MKRAARYIVAMGWLVAGCGGGSGGRPSSDGGLDGRPGGDATVDAPQPVGDANGDAGVGRLPVTDARPNLPAYILPVIRLDLPGVPIETLGTVPVAGDLTIVEDHDGTHADLGSRPPSFRSSAGIALLPPLYPMDAHAFTVEVRDAQGNARTEPLLGLPYQGRWALLPCWSDKTCMRNLLGYALGAALGKGSPRARFVEVYFMGAYQGLYQLVAPAAQGQGRLELGAPPGDSGEALTGPYVFRRDGAGESIPTAAPLLDWLSPTTAPGPWPNQMIYSYLQPAATEVTPAQVGYLKDHLARFEQAMKQDAWADPAQGYPAWIDVASWRDFAIVSEITNNVDSYWKDLVLTKQRDASGSRGLISATPFWDFTIAFGNANYRNGWRVDKSAAASAIDGGGECADAGWLPHGPPVCDANCCAVPACRPPARCFNMPYVPFYWERLLGQTSFQNEERCRYRELRRAGGPLDLSVLQAEIAGWKASIAPNAEGRHLARWPQLHKAVFPNPYDIDPRTAPDPNSTAAAFFDKEVSWLQTWLAARLEWLDHALPGACPGDVAPDAGIPADAATPPPPDDLTRGVIGYWKLDEGMGGVATDSSPLKNQGTLTNFLPSDWTALGYKGGALKFDASRHAVVLVPNAPALNPRMGLTVAAWINALDWLGNRRVLQKGDADNQYRLLVENGQLKFQVNGVTNGVITANLPPELTWHHLAATYDGQAIRLYVDGKVVAEDVAFGTIAITSNNLNIGQKTVGSRVSDGFQGTMDEVLLYDRGLSASEVARLAQGAQPF
jgi:hypothetical protein